MTVTKQRNLRHVFNIIENKYKIWSDVRKFKPSCFANISVIKCGQFWECLYNRILYSYANTWYVFFNLIWIRTVIIALLKKGNYVKLRIFIIYMFNSFVRKFVHPFIRLFVYLFISNYTYLVYSYHCFRLSVSIPSFIPIESFNYSFQLSNWKRFELYDKW